MFSYIDNFTIKMLKTNKYRKKWLQKIQVLQESLGCDQVLVFLNVKENFELKLSTKTYQRNILKKITQKLISTEDTSSTKVKFSINASAKNSLNILAIRYEKKNDLKSFASYWLFINENQEVTIPKSCNQLIKIFQKDFHEEDALYNSEARYSKLICEITIGILIQQKGKVVFANPACVKILGYKNSKELIGKSASSLAPKSNLNKTKSYLKIIEKKEVFKNITSQLTSKKGKTLDVVMGGLITEYNNEKAILLSIQDITDEVKLNESLARSEAQYRTVVNAISEGIIIQDLNKEILFSNRIAHKILGVSHQELVKQKSRVPRWKVIHEDGSEFLRKDQPGIVAMRTGKPQRDTIIGIYNLNRDLTWLNVNSYPVIDSNKKVTSAISFFLDITKEKKSREELKKMALVAQTTSNAVVITDKNQKIEWVNNAYEKLSGYTLQELFGKKAGELVQGPETSLIEINKIRNAVKNHKTIKTELINYSKKKKKNWISIHIQPIFNEYGKVTNYFSIGDNISDRIKKEKELKVLTKDLLDQNKELEQFNYVVSHNLRAPITNILGLSELLNDSNISSQERLEINKHIKASAHNLDEVLHDLSDVLHLHHSLNTKKVKITLKVIIETALYSIANQVSQTNAKINLT